MSTREMLRSLREMILDKNVAEDELARMLAGIVQQSARNMDAVPAATLYAEIEGLADYIKSVRLELSAMSETRNVSAKHIPSATDELDAVVAATEEATNTIMNCCDEISAVAGQLEGEHATALNASVSRIFEACTFQDITGQRITKVVRTLKHIEGQILRMVEQFDGNLPLDETEEAPTGDAALLNGPQLAANAASQDDIDKLMAEFDGPAQ